MMQDLIYTIKKSLFIFKTKHVHDFVFIHINKCGGTSIEKALSLPTFHDTAAQRRDMIGAERWEKVYKFTIIRNPYSRVVSHYNYRLKTNQTDLMHYNLPLNEWIKITYERKEKPFFDNPLMFMPAKNWITDSDSNIIVDDVFKLEELCSSWDLIAQKLKRRGTEIRNENKTQEYNADTAIKLLNTESVETINSVFNEDFNLFGYRKIT